MGTCQTSVNVAGKRRGAFPVVARKIIVKHLIAEMTKATVGGVTPFSLVCLSHSHE